MSALAYTCACTPLPLVHAAGLVPHRLLPTEARGAPDQAGAHLHDNLCPHVKRVLDRALAGALPGDLAGVVLMPSCDAMRRLADAWRAARPADRVFVADLPVTTGQAGVPVLNLEVDCIDPRSFAPGQLATRLEAFLELIQARAGT